jgi:transcriptional regulator with GAF, ATPase, and Fis domain
LQAPPLRDRRDDIPMLAEHFLKQAATRLRHPSLRLSQSNVEQLRNYSWPGNVRELQNVIERAAILSSGGALCFELKEADERKRDSSKKGSAQLSPLTRKQTQESQRTTIEDALRKSGGKIYGSDGAAELLGLRPTTLNSKIAALGIKRR